MLTDIDGNRYVKFGLYQLKLDKDEILYVRSEDHKWEKLTTEPTNP